jgi:uncharacterized protein YpmB
MPMVSQFFLNLSIIEYSETEKISKTATIYMFRGTGMAASTLLCGTNKQTKHLISVIERAKSTIYEGNSKSKVSYFTAAEKIPASSWQAWVQSVHTGRFIMCSVILNIYNKKTKGPTLMELFTATGKLNTFFDN